MVVAQNVGVVVMTQRARKKKTNLNVLLSLKEFIDEYKTMNVFKQRTQ